MPSLCKGKIFLFNQIDPWPFVPKNFNLVFSTILICASLIRCLCLNFSNSSFFLILLSFLVPLEYLTGNEVICLNRTVWEGGEGHEGRSRWNRGWEGGGRDGGGCQFIREQNSDWDDGEKDKREVAGSRHSVREVEEEMKKEEEHVDTRNSAAGSAADMHFSTLEKEG